MEFIIAFIMLALFSIFFYMIGMRYFSLIPIIIFLFIFSHSIKNIFGDVKFSVILEKWSLILIWFVTMIGISGILFFIGIDEIVVYLILLVLNILLRILSHIFTYNDGKILFEIGTWIVVVVILGTTLFKEGFFSFFEAFSLLSSLMFGVYAFLQFIIGIFYETNKKRTYKIVILGIISLGSTIIKIFYPVQWIISLGFLMMGLIYGGIYVIQHREMPVNKTGKISVRRILAGERIFQRMNVPQWKISTYEWIQNCPLRFSRILEFINLGLLIFLLIFFFRQIFASSEIGLNIRYRIGIALFLINIFILKKIDCISDLSRFSLALVANFVLYSLLLIGGGNNINTILPILIVWGFACQFIIFYVDRINITFFTNNDYIYWTIVTCIASVCNIILLCNTGLPGQFLFSLIFIYLGIEGLLLYYIIQFLQERKISIENKEQQEKIEIQNLTNTNIDDSINQL